MSFIRTLWYNLRVMKFHGIVALSVVVAALASRADAGEPAHDAASLARALTAQGGAGLKFDFSAVVTYVCTNNFDRRLQPHGGRRHRNAQVSPEVLGERHSRLPQ